MAARPRVHANRAARPLPRQPAGLLRSLGPGLVTGAADDDPSGIATYSQLGAGFGYALGWTMLFSYPLMAAIQEVAARIGLVTGRGIADNLRRHYPPAVLRAAVLILLVANIVNLGADIGAMASALGLLVGGPEGLYALLLAALSVGLEIWMSYERYATVLKWLTLSLFAYVGTALVAGVPWREALAGTLLPRLSLAPGELTALVAVLGTTISPYLFFWQSAQEVEERRRRHHGKPLRYMPGEVAGEIRRVRVDTLVGMGFSNLIALFIIVATAATLHASGVRDIESSAQAAEALRPLAGELAYVLFAAGILGTGLLAVPVLAGSAAYAVGEALRWPTGLGRKPKEAKSFYATIAAAALIGVVLDAAPIDPIKALYWSAVLNGVLAPPLMAVMLLMGSNPEVMGRLVLPLPLRLAGWTATAVMGLTVLGMIASWL
jgi:NRAMP (natural resistance-associated macrophage protein)-like metal ion transporter